MSKLAIVYWSGTGNTESMAAMVAAGAKEAGAQVDLFTAAEFGPQQMDLSLIHISEPTRH